ncbi:MAG: zinc ribbon domain-containing protein, partial [Bacilli bacterium]|nr:zinc ribbon domain-containing protein [Bacilli bacterium]
MYCVNCGKELNSENKFCAYCGTKVKDDGKIENLKKEDVLTISEGKNNNNELVEDSSKNMEDLFFPKEESSKNTEDLFLPKEESSKNT